MLRKSGCIFVAAILALGVSARGSSSLSAVTSPVNNLNAIGGGSDPGPGPVDTPVTSPTIKVLSNRSDMISGDDALVEVLFPASADPSKAKVLLNKNDITSQFALRANKRYMALVQGLALGDNTLTVQYPGAPDGNSPITNFPNGGPIFSGPQTQPWTCQQAAVDAQCNQPAEYTYLYKSTDQSKTGLLAYDPKNPPSDVTNTTLADGTTLPFIVRQERGYQDRDEYKILVLFQPGKDWQPWAAQSQWNHKLLITHGGSCGSSFGPSGAPLNDYSGTIPDNPITTQSYITALGLGFAVASTALDNTGHNCNVAVEAESLMMVKERLVEKYGELRYTMGTGCSGGSIAQHTIANAYPGIYQGLITMCAYPDTFSAGAQFANYHMLRRYFEGKGLNELINSEGKTTPTSPDPSQLPGWLARGVAWSPTQFADVEGHILPVNAIVADIGLFIGATEPVGNCAGANSYRPDTNPGGVRCGVIDFLSKIFGYRDASVWSPMEKAANKSFVGIPLGNEGVQYGLNALRLGKITPAQFVDLNVYIGGLDVDIKPQAARTRPDTPALTNVYRSGMINNTENMNTVAILNFVGPDPGIAHDTVHAFWVRWRLDRAHGNHDNHVMWAGPTPLIGDINYVHAGIKAMDRWLEAIEKDKTVLPLAKKITQDKPADIHDQCSNGSGVVQLDSVCVDLARAAFAYGTPSTVAGDDHYADKLGCQLKPFDRNSPDYTYALTQDSVDAFPKLVALPIPIPFTADQLTQLAATFPTGVCDFSKPAKDLQRTIPWLQYGTATQVIIGGASTAAMPTNSRNGWASPTFVF